MKQFVKVLDHTGKCFSYVCFAFLALRTEKKKAIIFDGTQIKTLLNDQQFVTSIFPIEVRARKTFGNVMKNFLRIR